MSWHAPQRGSSGGLLACGGGGACELSLDASAIADADRRRGAGGARGRAGAASGPLAPRRFFEYDGVVGGAVWHGHGRVGIAAAAGPSRVGRRRGERASPTRRCAHSDGVIEAGS